MKYQNDEWPNKKEFDKWVEKRAFFAECLKKAREHKKTFHKTSRKIVCQTCKQPHYAEIENDIV